LTVSVTAVCRRFGWSRKAGYKWLERYRLDGIAGLSERSRAPHTHPQAVAAAIAERCLAVRRTHRSWGPVKVRAWLERDDPAVVWPAASTIGGLFDREGLTIKRRLRRRAPPSSAPFAACGDANAVWCIDFIGWFLTGDGTHCEPLTLRDAYGRYLLRCQPLGRTDSEHVWPVLAAAFLEFGLPARLRSDNGPPFASTGAGGLSRLAVKVVNAGVRPKRIAPGQPQQNGRLERMHLTLLRDTANPAARSLRDSSSGFAISSASTMRSARMPRWATPPRPSTTGCRRGPGTASCVSPNTRLTQRCGGSTATVPSAGAVLRSI
jgi:putative transposase